MERSFWQYKVYADIRGDSLVVKCEWGSWKWRFSLHSFIVFWTFYIHGHTTAFRWHDCQWPWNMPKVSDSRITWKLSCGHVCKMFRRQWPNEPKIAIFNDPTLIDASSPANPREYLHKPYTARNYVPWLHFCRWHYMRSSANFLTVLSESRRRQPISCRARNRF